jgi:hypothetical protein
VAAAAASTARSSRRLPAHSTVTEPPYRPTPHSHTPLPRGPRSGQGDAGSGGPSPPLPPECRTGERSSGGSGQPRPPRATREEGEATPPPSPRAAHVVGGPLRQRRGVGGARTPAAAARVCDSLGRPRGGRRERAQASGSALLNLPSPNL